LTLIPKRIIGSKVSRSDAPPPPRAVRSRTAEVSTRDPAKGRFHAARTPSEPPFPTLVFSLSSHNCTASRCLTLSARLATLTTVITSLNNSASPSKQPTFSSAPFSRGGKPFCAHDARSILLATINDWPSEVSVCSIKFRQVAAIIVRYA